MFARIRSLSWLAIGAVTYAALFLVNYIGLGSASAGTIASDPVIVAVTTAGDQTWDLAVTDGPIWAGLMIVSGLLRTFINKQHWLAQGKVLSGLTGVSLVLASIVAWHFMGAPASGILTALLAGYALVTHSTVPGAVPKAPGGTGAATMLIVLLLGVGAVSGTGCSGARSRSTAAVGAFLDCETPHVDATMLADAKVLATESITTAISGDGHVDAIRLKADAAPLKSDLLRCAFDAAIAAMLTPVPALAGAPMSAGMTVDTAQLRTTYANVRAELGWAPAKPTP